MLIITPKTKIGEMLDAYPFLEDVLMSISSTFSSLKNPILRKTVGKVATLQQASAIGGLKVEDLVNRLRVAIGLEPLFGSTADSEYLTSENPDWLDPLRIVKSFDARIMISNGESPMNMILDDTNHLKSGEIYELITPFIPAPILDILKSRGFSITVKNEKDYYLSLIGKITSP